MEIVNLGNTYPYTTSVTNLLALTILIAIQYILTSYFVTMRARVKVFNKEFMAQFDQEHKNALGQSASVPKFGYPDCGNGYYAKKLSYADWFYMNNG